MRLKPWDYAAGSLLVQEAGGEVQMPLDGGGMDYDLSAAVLAANPLCMPEALEVFRRLKDRYPSKVILASVMGRNAEEWQKLARLCQENGADAVSRDS